MERKPWHRLAVVHVDVNGFLGCGFLDALRQLRVLGVSAVKTFLRRGGLPPEPCLIMGTAMDIYQEIVAIRRRGEKGALATLIRQIGSTPRKDLAKMLIRQDGSLIGTVGGGCTEAEVWQAAQNVMNTGKSTILKFHLNETDAARDGLVCGGTVEFFIEPILPDPALVVFGAGHISNYLSKVAKLAGFKVTVVDDRARYASREKFPEADEVIVCDFSQIKEKISLHSNSYIIIVTRGHAHDQTVLEQVIDSQAKFLGMVGSRRKSKIIFDYLRNKGVAEQLLARVESPVGLEIGSETPEEIAVSIVAEMIAARKGVPVPKKKKLPAQDPCSVTNVE